MIVETGRVVTVVSALWIVCSVPKNALAFSASTQSPNPRRTWSRTFGFIQLSQKRAPRGGGGRRAQAAEVEIAVFVLLTEAVDASVEAAPAEVMVAVEISPSLFVKSESTMTCVDVVAAVSLACEVRVVGGVVSKTVEVFAGVDVLEGTVAVVVGDGQIFVVLKPKVRVAFSQMVRLVRAAIAALCAMSESGRLRGGLPAKVKLGARSLPLRDTAEPT